MSARFPCRLQLKTWYGLLVVIWALLTLPMVLLVLTMGPGTPSKLTLLLEMIGASFTLVRTDPLSIALFAWLWLPILAAPFGLFARIDQE